MRQEYASDYITIYSYFEEALYFVNDIIMDGYKRFYYGQFKEEDIISLGAIDHEAGMMKMYTRRRMSSFFKDYPDFMRRTRDREFNKLKYPVEIVKIWEQEYFP